MKQRLQKLISAAGLTSRRKSEELIKMGKVTVNGIPAALGDSADPDTDIICVDGKLLAKCEDVRSMALVPTSCIPPRVDSSPLLPMSLLVSSTATRLITAYSRMLLRLTQLLL